MIPDQLPWKLKDHLTADVLSTAAGQVWQLASGPFLLVFVQLYLTAEIQGYWFTSASLAALAVFADLGFTNIVLQFSAHEFAHLSFSEDNLAHGRQENLQKLASFFNFSIKWAVSMAALAFPIILCAGFMIFSGQRGNIHWGWPWALYVCGSALVFLNVFLLAFIQGCGQVSRAQNISLANSVVNSVLVLAALYGGCGLFSLAIGVSVSALFTAAVIYMAFGKFFLQLRQESAESRRSHSWKREFLGLFWKYSLSFGGGYFIFQIYTPMTFHYFGPVEAGKVGMSVALWGAIYAVASVWITAFTPQFNMHAAKREWLMLDRMLYKNLALSLGTYLLGAVSLFVIWAFGHGRFAIIDGFRSRLVGPFPMACLCIVWFIQVAINAIAVYLRAHKDDPFVLLTVVSALYVVMTTYACARFAVPKYIFLGFLSACFWGFPCAIFIFIKKRRQWHERAA